MAAVNIEGTVAEQRLTESKQPTTVSQHGCPGADLESNEPSIEEVERVYHQLDWRILPAFWVLYFICSAIRSNIGLAQTMNISQKHDLGSVLGITPKQISTGLALFYVCYVVFDFPSNLIMTRLSPRIWMSRIVIGVGLIGACFAAVKAAWSLYLLRLLLGIVIAGMWPGMSYYLTLFYPPSRTGKRIGRYFTASQVSASVVGLVSAGFQIMDGDGGLVGFQWMFLLYGIVGILVGLALLVWLPDRPLPPGHRRERKGYFRWLPVSPPALTGRDADVHYWDLKRVYHPRPWGLKDLGHVLIDWRLWPLLLMYFGVVGVGIGVQNYGTVIIKGAIPELTGVQLSLLFAPIWVMDLIAIVMVTPFSDRFHRYRALFFSFPVLIQIAGLLMSSYAGSEDNPWPRYAGLLLVGFGLGPTVPNTMAWTNEIFQKRHGEVGVAAASALVSGLGNLGSILTTYALYDGWESDAAPGPSQFHNSNLVMIGILCLSVLSAFANMALLNIFGNEPSRVTSEAGTADSTGVVVDGAGRREIRHRGFSGLFT